jgi:large subunit ribosomal protein L29
VKTRQLRELSDDDLAKELAGRREELFNLRFQDATGALDNTARLGQTKRAIARILTLQSERASSLERR